MATMRISPVMKNPDFDKSSVVIPDSEIEGVPQVEKQVEIDLSHAKRDVVRIYHPRERDEGVVETDVLDGEGSRAEQVEIEGSKGLAREKWKIMRMTCKGSTESYNGKERLHQSKRKPHVRLTWRGRSAPSSLRPGTRKITSREAADESGIVFGRSSPSPPRGATDSHRQVPPRRSSSYQLRSKRHIKDGQEESRMSSPYPQRNRLSIRERQAATERTSTSLTRAGGVETMRSRSRFRPYK
ncbi:hypothetical protein NPIL_367621 [Nephila pilipes]|uniref:Uncharacterized protein n=1 Tax=Nephila pilipes TaxID=299642 RepID=A0A8X6PUR1_NEPPI|nr:hypothetical protein NPIL_367621 [Nephila pilipes]